MCQCDVSLLLSVGGPLLPVSVYILNCSVAESIGRALANTYARIGSKITRYYSTPEDLGWAKVGFHVRSKAVRQSHYLTPRHIVNVSWLLNVRRCEMFRTAVP